MKTPVTFERIDRPRRLPDEVAAALTAAIENGQLRPGDRFPTEAVLSESFGVARTVVREAISLLKYDGVVDSRRGVGTFITENSNRSAFRISPSCFEKRQQIIKLLQLRAEVQAGASALAAEKRSIKQMQGIQERFIEMERLDALGPDGALESRVDIELDFYRSITEASGNEYYIEVIGMIEGNIQSNLRSAFLKNAAASEFGVPIINEHRAVRDALATQDIALARQATRLRFEHAAERIAAREDFL